MIGGPRFQVRTAYTQVGLRHSVSGEPNEEFNFRQVCRHCDTTCHTLQIPPKQRPITYELLPPPGHGKHTEEMLVVRAEAPLLEFDNSEFRIEVFESDRDNDGGFEHPDCNLSANEFPILH